MAFSLFKEFGDFLHATLAIPYCEVRTKLHPPQVLDLHDEREARSIDLTTFYGFRTMPSSQAWREGTGPGVC
jgi:hypothetical protein